MLARQPPPAQHVSTLATRSDGRPMFTCDANGNCTRNSSDDPFSAGTTTITWFAYSHDAAGPYETPGTSNPDGDTFEEQHRTGSASCTQTIQVNDVTPPTIAAADSTVYADGNCQAVIPDYSSTALTIALVRVLTRPRDARTTRILSTLKRRLRARLWDLVHTPFTSRQAMARNTTMARLRMWSSR